MQSDDEAAQDKPGTPEPDRDADSGKDPAQRAAEIPTEEVLAEMIANGAQESVHLPIEVQIADEDPDDVTLRKLASHGVRMGKGMIAPAVFWSVIISILAEVAFEFMAPDSTSTVVGGVNYWFVMSAGWYYLLIIRLFVYVTIAIGFSPFFNIPLSRKCGKLKYGLASMYAMLFS